MKKYLVLISLLVMSLSSCTEQSQNPPAIKETVTEELTGYVTNFHTTNNYTGVVHSLETKYFYATIPVIIVFEENNIEKYQTICFKITDIDRYIELIQTIGQPRKIYKETIFYEFGTTDIVYELGDLIEVTEDN